MRAISLTALAAIVAAAVLVTADALAADDGTVLSKPELVVTRHGADETLAMPAGGYRDFSVAEQEASFVLTGQSLPAGSAHVMGHGISRVSWEPQGADTLVKVQLASAPLSSLINAVAATEERPQTPQVIAGFIFDAASQKSGRHPVVGSYGRSSDSAPEDQYGNYKLPALRKVKYSDVLVTLEVHNVDFRDVLWLLSEIGNVSIMLDPYWASEPTGTRRPPGAGADPSAGGEGGGEPGFRDGGGFIPTPPREGTGLLTLNFRGVPFDQALDLIIMSAGLVKVDIWPNGETS